MRARMGRWTRTPSSALSLALCFALGVAPLPALAAKKKPGPAAPTPQEDKVRAEAKMNFQSAQKAYSLGQFSEALGLYSEAYRIDPQPAMLYNIAQCHRMLGNHERAIFFYTRFLDAFGGNPKNAKLVRELIAESQTKQAEASKLQAEREASNRERELEMARYAAARAEAEAVNRREAEARSKLPPDAGMPGDAPLASSLTPGGTSSPSQPAGELKKDEQGLTKKWWFWAAVGGVAIAAGATAYVATAPQGRPTTLGTWDMR
jgi:tetratricopeptide (TPR) repeat protein